MALVKFHKVTALPGTLEGDAFYYVENGDYAETYVTNSSGVAKSVGNSAMINALISAALTDFNSLEIVPDITARDALALERNALVLVTDATGDTSVDAGAAMYAYNESGNGGLGEWTKIAEYEAMDVVIQWSNIDGRPTSTPAQIDAAVSASHTHTNKAVLDDLSDSGGKLHYKGAAVTNEWATIDW